VNLDICVCLKESFFLQVLKNPLYYFSNSGNLYRIKIITTKANTDLHNGDLKFRFSPYDSALGAFNNAQSSLN